MAKLTQELGKGVKKMLDKMNENEDMRKNGVLTTINYMGRPYIIAVQEYVLPKGGQNDQETGQC